MPGSQLRYPFDEDLRLLPQIGPARLEAEEEHPEAGVSQVSDCTILSPDLGTTSVAVTSFGRFATRAKLSW